MRDVKFIRAVCFALNVSPEQFIEKEKEFDENEKNSIGYIGG